MVNVLAMTRSGATMKAYAALFMILIAAMTIPLYPAQADTEAPESRVQPTPTGSLGDDSTMDDASALARDLGVDRAVAKEILSAQGASHEVRGALRRAAGENFVDLNFRATSEPALVLTLSGDAIPQAVREIVERSEVQVEIVLPRTPPESEFLAIVDRSWAEFATTPGLTSQDSDPGTGTIVFYFDPDSESNLVMFSEEVTRFIDDDRITIEAETLTLPEELQRRGGNPLRLTSTQVPECTQGFSVKKSGGPKGVLTAAHCRNNLQYLPLGGGTWKNMTFKQQVYNDRADYQWHTIGAAPLSSFFGSSSTDVRPVTGSIPRADMDGDYVCHRGRTTGYY